MTGPRVTTTAGFRKHWRIALPPNDAPSPPPYRSFTACDKIQWMEKKKLRAIEGCEPSYPTLDDFDASRRRFVGAVAAVAVTGGLATLFESGASAASIESDHDEEGVPLSSSKKGGKKKKKKKKKPPKPKPHPPTGGAPPHPSARSDETLSLSSSKEGRKKKKKKKKKKKPHPPTGGVVMLPSARGDL